MTDDTATEHTGFRIEGRVQGVGFRWWTRRLAEELGVDGSVRNLPDGSVEVLARGPSEVIRTFESRLHRGPSSAIVRSVERFGVDGVRRSGFAIEP